MLDSVVCFGSNGDVVVIECVGYVFWVCVCFVLIHECCWGCPGAGFGRDYGSEDLHLFFWVFSRLRQLGFELGSFCFVDGFSQSVPIFPVAFSVCFARLSYASLM